MKSRRKTKKSKRKQKGGFIPSIMEGFCMATSKYITPITLLLLHKMLRSKSTRRVKK
jgi:hypothetical protein